MLLVILATLVVSYFSFILPLKGIFLSLKEGIFVIVKRCFYYSLLYKLIGFDVSEIGFLMLLVILVTLRCKLFF